LKKKWQNFGSAVELSLRLSLNSSRHPLESYQMLNSTNSPKLPGFSANSALDCDVERKIPSLQGPSVEVVETFPTGSEISQNGDDLLEKCKNGMFSLLLVSCTYYVGDRNPLIKGLVFVYYGGVGLFALEFLCYLFSWSFKISATYWLILWTNHSNSTVLNSTNISNDILTNRYLSIISS
jgi:hypothetical protein